MPLKKTTTRRSFLRQSGLAATAAATGPLLMGTRASGEVRGANDRFRVAIAGINGRGRNHISSFNDIDGVEIAYLVDPDANVLANRLNDLGGNTKGVADIREVLDDPDVDAVSIATPNHWHSLMTIWSAQAGKHVYVEKPISHDVFEGRVVCEAQKKYGVVIQHGTQRRSSAGLAGLNEAIHAGEFGRLKISYGYACKKRNGIGHHDPSEPPSHLDWDLWQGPAEVGDFHRNMVHYNWHWFWSAGNGDLNNQGTHQLDVAHWALDPGVGHPVRVMALGGRFKWNDQGETPNTMMGIAEFANGQQMFFNVRNVDYDGYLHQVENEYYFEDGGRIVGGEYFAAGSNQGERVRVSNGHVTSGGPYGSFVNACRAGDPSMANGDAEVAHFGSVVGHLMNNSYRLGEQVPFNKKAGRFGDNKDAYEHFEKFHDLMANDAGVPEDEEQYTVGPWLEFDPETERHVGEHADAANALLRKPVRKGYEIPEPDKV